MHKETYWPMSQELQCLCALERCPVSLTLQWPSHFLASLCQQSVMATSGSVNLNTASLTINNTASVFFTHYVTLLSTVWGDDLPNLLPLTSNHHLSCRWEQQHQVLWWVGLLGVHRKLVRPALQTCQLVPTREGGHQHRVPAHHEVGLHAEEGQHQQQERCEKGGVRREETDQNYHSRISRPRRCWLDKGTGDMMTWS